MQKWRIKVNFSSDLTNKPKKLAHFLHRVGVNSTNRVKTSSLPSSIAVEHTQVWNPVSTP
jgi:hypothetical protein